MNTFKKEYRATFFAVLAAALYAVSAPLSKLLLTKIPSVMMAALLYLGAGIGMTIIRIVQKIAGKGQKEQPLTRMELPYMIGMIALDAAAPILLMSGLNLTSAANVSLISNFEIAATSIIAFVFFKEAISKRLWFAVALVTVSSLILSFQDFHNITFSIGSVFVLLACICWGFENNCTRRMSSKNPLQIVIIKGIGSGTVCLTLAAAAKSIAVNGLFIVAALLLGFMVYGLGVFFYVYAQRWLGAAKTSIYYAVSPFIGVVISLIIFTEIPSATFWAALAIMAVGVYFASTENR